MDRLARFKADELVGRMRAEFEKVMAEVTQAVNGAADGHLIDGSEERCRDLLGELRRLAYETAVQLQVEENGREERGGREVGLYRVNLLTPAILARKEFWPSVLSDLGELKGSAEAFDENGA